MRPPLLTLLLAATLLSGCGEDVTAEYLAADRFAKFQTALFARDRAALKQLICRDARPAIPELCRADLDGRKPLIVTGITRNRHEYRVHVTDPNHQGAAKDSFYVLTKEDGHLRVDLLATFAYHRRSSGRGISKLSFVPGRLTPEQVERARATLPATSYQAGR